MPETRKDWVDFRHVREAVDFAAVLQTYGVELKLRGGGDQHQGFCPLPTHEGQGRSPSFSAHLGKKAFQCFGCKAKGNVIEFVACMEGWNPDCAGDIRKAALLIQKRFMNESAEPPKVPSPQSRKQSPGRHQHKPRRPTTAKESEPETDSMDQSEKQKTDNRSRVTNAPLDFELKQLDPDHPYLEQRGLAPETIREFGLGFCSRGLMVNRIAIPLHDAEGTLIGYAGRLVDDTGIDEENPKFRLPGPRERDGKVFEFSKSAFLFNGHRVQAPVSDLIVVEGFFSVFHLHQCGFPNVVALMGSSCSPEQADLIVRLTTKDGRVWLMPDGDKGGRECAESLFAQISPQRPVRSITLNDGTDPCDYTREQLVEWLDDKDSSLPARAEECGSNLKHIQMVSLRLVREKTIPYESRILTGSQEAYAIFRELAEDLDREALWVACLDTKNKVTCLSQVSLGTLSAAPASPMIIMRLALLSGARGIILIHNHPSGDPEPSADDRAVTRHIKEAARLLDIKLMDHLIIGDGAYYSFSDHGDL